MKILLIINTILFLQVNTDTLSEVYYAEEFRKEQVSFDSDGNLIEITEKEANRLKIFQNIEGFLKVSVYKSSPSEYTIELHYKEDSKIYMRDSTLSEVDFMSLRATIDSLLLLQPEKGLKLDRSGWGLFLLAQLQVASSEWGPLAISLLPEGTSQEVSLATYLLTSASGFFVPFYLTLDRPITLGQALLSYSWAHQGYYAGFVLRDLLNFTDTYDRTYPATALAGSVLGSWSGYSFAGKYNLSAGRGDLLAWTGYWGGIYGGLGTFLLIPWEDSNEDELRWKLKIVELSGLLGLGYGSYLWYTKAKDIYSYGDALAYRTYTLLSALTTLNILFYLPEPDSEWEMKGYIAAGMAINGIGMWKGLRLFTPVDLGFVDGLAVTGGTIAGSLVGSAIAVLTKPDDGKKVFSMILAGGWAGYGLTYEIIKGKGVSGDARLQLYPESFACLWISKRTNTPLSAPIISLSF
ncbi:MAG: hypothetical protein COT45_06095 [bacterium (Candidatus Stahlbacteria) CG08_land_8_20_14_0_20_40_26]|nr:MAG: hypothetical protein COX49_04325 [bacterium (Candidatus Stahlbacteria) CG23_combo_of_CG06-09_8_20_14_all_40_9]PIS23547.1 MAG: hypothetical protein COT45_06095 [bacterium (Candidatus Stahlbacteria) CG08_land_8_20_14_0_20_40_26]